MLDFNFLVYVTVNLVISYYVISSRPTGRLCLLILRFSYVLTSFDLDMLSCRYAVLGDAILYFNGLCFCRL